MTNRAFPGLLLSTLRANFRLRLSGVPGVVSCEGRPPLVVSGGEIVIGRRLALRGRQAPIELGANPGGELRIGDHVFINSGATVVANSLVTIGDFARIGEFVAVLDSNYHAVDQLTPVRVAPIRIGMNTWIGRAAVVLPGVTIGDHSVIAAGSIVTRDVPARSLVAGSPARLVRALTADDGWLRG